MKVRTLLLIAAPLVAVAGIFGACEKSNDVVLQEQFQDAANACPQGCQQPKQGCTIKGNISGAGLHWYFMPEDREYGNVIIEPSKGEAWFCSPAEAEVNGFNPLPDDF
jgi:hypothetical protein